MFQVPSSNEGLSFPFKFIYGQPVNKSRICIPCDILNLFKKTSSCHSYTTTASASVNICVNSSDLELYKLYFSRFAAKLWNEIPCHIRHLSANKFKQTLCKLLFDILNSDDDYIDTPTLRWLDTIFQGQYLPCLSINYVAINKVLEKLPPRLY